MPGRTNRRNGGVIVTILLQRAVELCVTDERWWKPTVGEATAWMLSHVGDFPIERLRSFEPDRDPRKLAGVGSGIYQSANVGQ